MTPQQQEISKWFRDQWMSAFAAVIESMLGERPEVTLAASTPDGTGFRWVESLDLAPDAVLGARFPEESWKLIGSAALAAVGVEDADTESARATFQEILGQTISAVISSITARAGREVRSSGGKQADDTQVLYDGFRTKIAGQEIVLAFGFSKEVLEALAPAQEEPKPKTLAAAAGAESAAAIPSTLDLILDVELPVSVSFGRAQVPLKDVLKLTSGSIVELNRAVSEPVEVIVNNCVIARGEVVVVEGNYGIRIQEIVSRAERLRTLY